MHPRTTVDTILALKASGVAARAAAVRTGVPLGTVRHWYREDRRRTAAGAECPRVSLDEVAYAYLLGSYLGDGHIAVGRRGVASLSVFCSDDWPGVRREVEESLRAVMPSSAVCLVARTGCHEVKSYSTHWCCLFPQHGPGRKHTRAITLEPWQRELVEKHPGRLLRGLFHSDGCRVVNWAPKRHGSPGERYEYSRYLFSNKSDDILGICEQALDLLGIPHRRPRWDMISVARRDAVAALDAHVGPKS